VLQWRRCFSVILVVGLFILRRIFGYCDLRGQQFDVLAGLRVGVDEGEVLDCGARVVVVSLHEKVSRCLVDSILASRCRCSIYHIALNFIIFNKNDPIYYKTFKHLKHQFSPFSSFSDSISSSESSSAGTPAAI
jgi:hypothetical protein